MEIILKLFSFFLFLLYVAAKSQDCPDSHCLRSGPAIRFPFQLSNQTGPGSCGYPGFDLISCGASNETTIHLQSVPFIVRGIDYQSQQIRINDPDHCLPGKILSLSDLRATPFRGAFYEQFSFFSCSSGHRRPELQPIQCLSNSTHSVYATSSSSPPSDLLGACDVIKKVYVPVQSPSFGRDVPSSVLFEDIVLQWDSPDCKICEAHKWRCGLEDGPGLEISCFFHDDPRDVWWVWLICLCAIVVLCIRLLIPPIMKKFRALRASGSAPKSEVGDSDRMSHVCPICLSGIGIGAGETPKTLNQCQHSFHARCIDEWLQRNATCPVCRQHTTITVT